MQMIAGRIVRFATTFLRRRLPAAEPRRVTSFVHADVGSVARSCLGARNAMRLLLPVLLSVALLSPAQPALADFTQNGPKLVGTGAGGTTANQGQSVALSADGHTAIVGGPADINNAGGGAAWVFTRGGGVWSQQGDKLVGTGAVGTSVSLGFSVALSADGNTAIVGGPSDNAGAGAAWVFTRSGGMWTQQGGKLVGSGAVARISAPGRSETSMVRRRIKRSFARPF
jgi:hypothetical protein